MNGGILAAGGVLWRDGGKGPVIGVVHRPRYDDWSLPKGKLLTGEHPVIGAHREVVEETGLTPVLGRPLGSLSYARSGADGPIPKVVRYWAMSASAGSFVPNDEVDEMAWLAPEQARRRLSYARDIGPLEAMLARPYRTTTVLLVRHARAGRRGDFAGEDAMRPLDGPGRDQAGLVRDLALCFGVTRVLAADRLRCVQTVQPLADALGVPVEVEPALTDSAHGDDPARSRRRLAVLARGAAHVAVCGQGDVIPDLVRGATPGGGPPEVRSAKASVWALSFAEGRLVDSEYLPAAEPSAG